MLMESITKSGSNLTGGELTNKLNNSCGMMINIVRYVNYNIIYGIVNVWC